MLSTQKRNNFFFGQNMIFKKYHFFSYFKSFVYKYGWSKNECALNVFCQFMIIFFFPSNNKNFDIWAHLVTKNLIWIWFFLSSIFWFHLISIFYLKFLYGFALGIHELLIMKANDFFSLSIINFVVLYNGRIGVKIMITHMLSDNFSCPWNVV